MELGELLDLSNPKKDSGMPFVAVEVFTKGTGTTPCPSLVLREREVLGSDAVAYAYVYGYEGNQVDEAKTRSITISSACCTIFPRFKCPNEWHVPMDEELTAMTSLRDFAGIMLKSFCVGAIGFSGLGRLPQLQGSRGWPYGYT